jgi:indole-3-glycerol phosphate synthase
MDCTDFLTQALEHDLGILIETTDVEVLKRKLYQARTQAQAAGINAFDGLTFRVDPRNPKNHLLILKKDREKNGQS